MGSATRDALCDSESVLGYGAGCYLFAPGTPERATCRKNCRLLYDRARMRGHVGPDPAEVAEGIDRRRIK